MNMLKKTIKLTDECECWLCASNSIYSFIFYTFDHSRMYIIIIVAINLCDPFGVYLAGMDRTHTHTPKQNANEFIRN